MKNPERRIVHRLQNGKTIDTSSFVYQLPYPSGARYRLVQTYYTHFTHKRTAALDFKMPIGSVICAARGGIVIRVKEDSNKGGRNKAYRQYGNHIIVQHSDSTRAGYWHLKYNSVLVEAGDSVKAGQQIAQSGNTGYTFFPHLHFIVWGLNENGVRRPIPTRFYTKKGARYLHVLRAYKNPGQ